jgi:phosphoribosyl 1,2-cyclic phosphodiesterase
MLSDKYQLPLFATAGTLGHQSLRDSAWARPIQPGQSLRIGEVEATAFSVPHDAREPVGYRLRAHAATVCVTTDLGFVPKEVGREFRDNDLLVLEANHDVEMLHAGPYPQFLKRRVLGDHGHLSNVATADALLACRDRVPSNVWLAHLSPTNNTPERAHTEIVGRLGAAGYGHVDLQVAARSRPSLHWSSTPRPVQLSLF